MKYKLFFIVVFLNSFFFISACEFLKPPQSLPPDSSQNQTPHGYLHQAQTGPNPKQKPYAPTQTAPRDFSQTNQFSGTACSTDADCVLVNSDCCGCKNGGVSIAVHRSQQSSHNFQWQQRCGNYTRPCHMKYRCGQARCHNSQCVMTSQ